MISFHCIVHLTTIFIRNWAVCGCNAYCEPWSCKNRISPFPGHTCCKVTKSSMLLFILCYNVFRFLGAYLLMLCSVLCWVIDWEECIWNHNFFVSSGMQNLNSVNLWLLCTGIFALSLISFQQVWLGWRGQVWYCGWEVPWMLLVGFFSKRCIPKPDQCRKDIMQQESLALICYRNWRTAITLGYDIELINRSCGGWLVSIVL